MKRSLLTSDDRTVCRKKPIKIYRQVGKLEVLIMLKVRVKMLVSQSCLTLCDPMDYKPTKLLCPWNSPSKNTGVGSHSLLHRGSSRPRDRAQSPTLQADFFFYHLSHQGSPCRILLACKFFLKAVLS